MAKHRRRTRTHVKPTEEELAKIPKSMVLSVGDALKNNSVTQLVQDMRNVMQPHTAINLKERKANKLKDFVVMAGPLGVSHMMIISQSDSGTVSMRLSRTPRGPTVTFKVKNYSLCKDVRSILKHPKSVGKESKEYLNPPLLVLNGFTSPAKAEPHEKVTITLLQSMFPPLTPQTMKVSSIKRVLILNKNKDGEIDLRHYTIDTKPVEISKSVKKLVNAKQKIHKKLPNLGRVNDVADFVLDPYANGAGFTSESEIEDDEIVQVQDTDGGAKPTGHHYRTGTRRNPSAATKGEDDDDEDDDEEPAAKKTKISLPSDTTAAVTAASETRKKAVKLTEIGPRIKLELIKIEEDVCSGKVLYHSRVNKTKAEIHKLEQKHALRKKLKLQRRKEQEEHVQAKNEKKEAKKLRRKAKEAKLKNGENVTDNEEQSESSGDEDSDVEMSGGDDDDDDKLFSDNE